MDEHAIESVWDEILAHVQAGKVVPIIGAEILEIEQDGGSQPLYRYVADKLADRLGLSADILPADPTLNDVVGEFFRVPGVRREDVFPRIGQIMKDAALRPPELLRKLARVRPFQLYVTLTFDSLLKQAIDRERFGGANRTIELAYSPNDPQDLSAQQPGSHPPVVYHLFGKVSPLPNYVVTDEQILEFLYHIQSPPRRPNLLFDELRTKHLLFIGCNFSDWLARFFIRITRNREFSFRGPELTVLADRMAASDRNLVVFLETFNYGTKIIPGCAADFVTELERRYTQLALGDGSSVDMAASDTDEPDIPAGSVFISYAKEDFAAARRLHDSLERAGIEAWFDKQRLEAGDAFARAIKRAIRNSCCFIPLISTQSTRRDRGFFRREWLWAQDEAQEFSEDAGFILPVVIDATTEGTNGVPEQFRDLHWVRLQDGEITDEFAAKTRRLQRDRRRQPTR